MSYNSLIWDSLEFVVNGAGNLTAGFGRLASRKDSDIVYRNNRAIKSVAVHVARQMAMQLVEQQINTLMPRYRHKIEKRLRDYVLQQQEDNYVQLIEQREIVDEGLGYIITKEGRKVSASNKYVSEVKESLMLYYDSDTKILVTDNTGGTPDTFETCTIWFTDFAPSVQLSSSKNIVMTKVQGRDYSRKELVSGGDLKFSVKGEIVGDMIDVRPQNEINKFIQIMNYNGVVKVNHFLFKNHNIDRILILSYSLGQPTFKNIQPYSFECVAVEPDDEATVTRDTIGVLNQAIQTSPMEEQYKLILDNKLVEILSNSLASAAAGGINSALGAGADAANIGE